jgi:hypothetical protein
VTEARAAPRPLVEVGIEPIAWIAASVLFIALRFAVTWQAPVGGEELRALSGAWQAAQGIDDARFVPTLFQGLTAWLFKATDSEVAPRVLAMLATATLPAAFFLLRPVLGGVVPLVALVLLAFDGPAIYTGVAATPAGFDLAITGWLFLLLARPGLLPWSGALAAAGFLCATAGPIVLPLLLAALVLYAPGFRAGRPREALWIAGGVAAGIVVASLEFGTGSAGVNVPPLLAFADGFRADVSTLATFDMLLLYSWPTVLTAVGSAALLLWRRSELEREHWLLLGWAGAAIAWLLAALPQGGAVPVAGATLPFALLSAYGVVAAVPAILRADWSVARFAIPAAVAMALVAVAYMVDWARVSRVGDNVDVARVVALLSAAVAALAVAAVERRSRATLLAPALALGAIVMVSGGFGVALSASSEPLPSPLSPATARVLRALALEAAADPGGEIVVHPDFREDVLWPFRDSGDLVVASRVTDDAAIVLWPANLPPPPGFAVVEGQWTLLDEVQSPTTGFLKLLRWYSHRNHLSLSHAPMAVYIRSE